MVLPFSAKGTSGAGRQACMDSKPAAYRPPDCEGNGLVALKVCCSRGLGKRSIQLALLVIVAGITCLLAASGENGVLSRFMLKPDRIIVERRPDPAYD